MSFLRYAAPALALASLATAQCEATGTTTVGAEATQLGSCSTFSGSIALATDSPATLDFGMLGSIDGDFVADTLDQVQTISAMSLANITGTFKMNNMTNLYTLNMQSLRGVGQGAKGGINWQGLPLLQTINFGSGLNSAAAIDIQNTMIQNLSAVNVKQAAMVNVVNNQALTDIEWSTQNCTNLTIAGNGPTSSGVNITLNSLEGVASLTVGNASSLLLPKLQSCDGLFSVASGGLQSLNLPDLTVAGGINVANSPQLTEVSFPSLQTCTRALKLINNDNLGGNISFPDLTQLRGDLNITGAFTAVSMPVINTIQGTSYLWSSEDISSTCAQFGAQGSYAGTKIHGKPIKCFSNTGSSSAGSTGTQTSSGGDSSSSSGAAMANFIAQPASLFGATGLFAAVLGLM